MFGASAVLGASIVLGASVSAAMQVDVPAGASLQLALDSASSGDTIVLGQGVHRIRQPLALTAAAHSLRIIAKPNASISGGAVVTSWKPSKLAGLLQSDVSALLDGTATWPRNLWVNGRRAPRAVLRGNAWTPWNDAKYSATADGYELASSSPLAWSDPRTVEMVYTAQGSQWTESRCPVASVEATGKATTLVRMMQPCWTNLVHKPCGQGTSRVARIENVGNLTQLDAGEWYLDWKRRTVYYRPLSGETASTLEAVLPISQGLVHAGGVAGLRFVNVTFEHDAWAQPNGPYGYVEQQSVTAHDDSNSAQHVYA